MRENQLMNHGWHFLPTTKPQEYPHTKLAMYLCAKTERLLWGPGTYHHPDEAEDMAFGGEVCTEPWQNVDVPHDYVIEGTPTRDETCALGFLKSYPAWYRRHFALRPEDEGKRLAFYFEGITGVSDIYLNGCFLKHHEGGYTSFEVDITDLARFDEENVLAVHVMPDSFETWWYAGGGIYRNVWLVKTAPVAVDLWGVFLPVRKESDALWKVPLEVSIRNITYKDEPVEIACSIVSPDGAEVGRMSCNGVAVARGVSVFKSETTVVSPALWDIDAPRQYTAVVTVCRNGVAVDSYRQRFGFREVAWSATEGFFLNGRNIKLKGVCAHLDCGLTGKAVPDNLCRYKAKLIKSMGANAFRATHYPHQEAFMDACDELGLLVMDETRRFESNDDALDAMAMLVKRDRNRPSVILWSTGNEEPYYRREQGRNIHRALAHVAKTLDGTRPVTTATSRLAKSVILDEMDVIGVNYSLSDIDDIHAKYPSIPMFGSEGCAVPSTRGWYFGDREDAGRYDARDRHVPFNGYKGREITWRFAMERPWFAGAFQWISIEHRGEAKWPRLCSVSGAIDLFLQKKDAYYQNQSHWLDTPMIHLLPHWNHRGKEGLEIAVWVYTNCEEAELFLDGESLGRKKIEKWSHGEWGVVYRPGRLEAVGYNDGKVVARDVQETTGHAERLMLRLDNGPVFANGEDVALFTCVALDGEGREVPDAKPTVRFDCTGIGRIIGTGSDNTDHVPLPSLTRRMYAGRITVAVKMGCLPPDESSAKLLLMAESAEVEGCHLSMEIFAESDAQSTPLA